MLSIQQMIKILRKLPNNIGVSSAGADELLKKLKDEGSTNARNDSIQIQTPTASNNTTETTIISKTFWPEDDMTSLSSSTTTPISLAELKTTQKTAEASLQANESSQRQPQGFLVYIESNQNRSGSHIADLVGVSKSAGVEISNTNRKRDFLLLQNQIVFTSLLKVTAQKQIINKFHTYNQVLQTKQKQIQFAMSSLAAEQVTRAPSLKPQEDVSAVETNDCRLAAAGGKDSSKAVPLNDKSDEQSCASSSKPCFNTGLPDILQFMELIGNLKHTKRTGWVLRDVNDCESISGHMYRMSMMTFLLDGSEGLNQIRCMELALVHDLAESLVGDITPFCGVSKQDKRAMEFKAMEDICKLIEPRGKRIMELFEEYEEGESAESKFVKDLDRLDMVMQAFEYEKRDNCLLKHQEFFDSTEGKFNHPFVKKLVNEIYEQRKLMAKSKGATPPPNVPVPPENNGNAVTADQSKSDKDSASS